MKTKINRSDFVIFGAFLVCLLMIMLGVNWIADRLLTGLSDFAGAFCQFCITLVFLAPLVYLARKALKCDIMDAELKQAKEEKNHHTKN